MYNCMKHGLTYAKECPQCYINKEQSKMTREEAVSKLNETVFGYHGQCKSLSDTANKWIEVFEALGLLKFDEPKKDMFNIFHLDDNYGRAEWHKYQAADDCVELNKIVKNYGVIRLELWPEGLVLWVGGEIKWKSWVNPVPDLVVIEARKYVDDCRVKPYSKEEAFSIIGDHFKMLEKLLEYVENK